MTSFSDLGLSEPILRAISAENYSTPTPIQAQAIPHLIEGRDLLGVAQTGTGKTAAFALPILHRLSATRTRPIPQGARTLVLTPTRELAIQIGDSFKTYGANLPLGITVVTPIWEAGVSSRDVLGYFSENSPYYSLGLGFLRFKIGNKE